MKTLTSTLSFMLAFSLMASLHLFASEDAKSPSPANTPILIQNTQSNQLTQKPTGKKINMRAKTGGSIQRPIPEGSHAIVLVDATDGSPSSTNAIENIDKKIAKIASLFTKRMSMTEEELNAFVQNNKGDVVVALLPRNKDFAVYPEKRLAIVPLGLTLATTERNLWKATVSLFTTLGQGPNDMTSMNVLAGMAEANGIPRIMRVFYKKALEEGWAPPPADEYQQALWDAFHAK